MRVALCRRAMGGPACVADAGEPRQRFLVEQLRKLAELAGAAAAVDSASVQRGDARGIIAAIFETPERIYNEGRYVARSGNTDDSTHDSTVPVLLGFVFRPDGCRASRFDDLPRTAEGQSIRRDIFRDDASGPDICAVADLQRRHQRRMRADEDPRADIGEMLVVAVVIAGDGPGADIAGGANPRIADIGQMIGFDALLQTRVLYFDEIADMHRFFQHRAGPEARERSHDGAGADFRPFEVAEGPDLGAPSHRHAGAEHDIGADDGVGLDRRIGGNVNRLGGGEADPALHDVDSPP